MDLNGRSLAADTIAFYLGYVPRPLEPFPMLIIDGLISRTHHYQKHLLIHRPMNEHETDMLYESLVHCGACGLVMIPPNNRQLFTRLSQSGIPVVAIADRAPEIPSVVMNDEMGAFMLAEHLSLRGYRKVMYRRDIFTHESSARRYNAFADAARYLGIEVIDTRPIDSSANLSPEEERYLLAPAGKRPSAVVSWVDIYIFPVLKFCKLHGLNIPKDIAVAGFDGISSTQVEPARRLTTIQAPWFLAAEKAVDLVMQCLRGEQTPKETVLPVDLVIGDTT